MIAWTDCSQFCSEQFPGKLCEVKRAFGCVAPSLLLVLVLLSSPNLLVSQNSDFIFDDHILHFSFAESKTGIFLKDVGLDELALSYYESASLKYAEGHAWAERNLPVAKAKLDVAVMQLGLYWQKALASLAWTYNWLVQKVRISQRAERRSPELLAQYLLNCRSS